MRGRNPRRDALEYAVLLTVATSLSVGFGLLIYMKYNEDGEGAPPRQRLNLNTPVDLQQAWRELQLYGRGGGNGSNQSGSGSKNQDGGDRQSK